MATIKEQKEADQRREKFRHSEEGVKAALESGEDLLQALLALADQYRDESTGYVFSNEKEQQGGLRRSLRLYAVGCTLLLDLRIPFTNSIQGSDHHPNAHVNVRFSDGVIRKGRSYYDRPVIKRDAVWEYDVDGRGNEGWKAPKGDTLISPDALAVSILTDFVEFVETNRTR